MKSMSVWSISFIVVAFIATFYGVGAKKKNDVDGQIQRKDLEYLKCDVCKRVSAELVKAMEDGRSKTARQVIGEFQIVEIMDTVCKPKNLTTGSWTRRIDIVEKSYEDGKTYLEFSEPGGKQVCNSECATLAKSCDSLLEAEIDADDFSAYLYRSKPTTEALEEKLCKKLTKRCVGPKKGLPKHHNRIDDPFSPMDDQQAKVEELSAMMRDAGVKGDLRSREDMADMVDDYNDQFNPYEDDYGDSLAHPKSMKHHPKTFAPPGYARNSHEKQSDDL